jgi:DNA-binding transcriptional MerR regulator
VPDDLLSIGELARAGGPPVSALRYYDAAGVLRPAHVDPATGYRWYTSAQVHTARLVASLRQAGLPVADLVAVLAAPDRAHAVLARHRRRLEEDLAAAGAHLDTAADILAEPGRGTVDATELAGAVAAVRHAVGADPEWPALAGILLHLDGPVLRLVGCDRRRLAVATIPVGEPSGPETRVVATLEQLDAATSVAGTGTIALGARVLDLLGVSGAPLDAAYPDYEQLLWVPRARTATAASDALVGDAAQADDVVVVRLDGDRVRVTAPRARDVHGFSRTFLLDAVRAAGTERVHLALEDRRSVLSVSPSGRPDDVGLVMPVLLRG